MKQHLKRILGLCSLTMFVLAPWAIAQDYPKVEIFGGYSYLDADREDYLRTNLSGWEVSADANVHRHAAVEFLTGVYYKGPRFYDQELTETLKLRNYSVLIGPRVNFRPLFLRALVGVNRYTGRFSIADADGDLRLSLSQHALAAIVGGGIEMPISNRVAFRIGMDYFFTRHEVEQGIRRSQLNVRATSGVVFALGGGFKRKAIEPSASKPTTSIEMTGFGASGYPTAGGFEVTAVATGSPATQVFLRAGDIIRTINGHPVRNAAEIDAALTAAGGGIIKITGLTKAQVGIVAFERELPHPPGDDSQEQ